MLRERAKIAVVAPAGIPKFEELEAGENLLRAWGYSVVEGARVRNRHFYHAGRAADRTADLDWALSDPGIDAVWLARGGYGCAQCLPGLSLPAYDDRPVIGFSDATALFCGLSRHGRTRLIHGPVVGSLSAGSDDESRERIRALLSGAELGPIRGRHLCGPRNPVSGPLRGGNLCVLASLAGTPWQLRAEGAVVVLEDVGEAAYRIDRFIHQLRWSGALEGAAGIALGDFVSCRPPEGAEFTLEDVLREALEPLGIPVATGLPIGHAKRNLAWRIGESVVLAEGELRFGASTLAGGGK